MARVRLITDEPRIVPWLGRTVQPDEVVTIPDEHTDPYTCQPAAWELVEEPKTTAPTKRAPKDGE
jgi:hypothetical protein